MIFDINFFEKTRRAFKKAKQEIAALKVTLNDWIQYLCRRDNELEARIAQLEAQVQRLQREKELRM